MEAVDAKLAIPTPIYWGSNVLAVLLLVSSIVGLIFGADGFYAFDPNSLPQILGQDLITLIFGVPLLLACVKQSQQGSVKGMLLWAGLLLYFAYAYYFYVIGVRFNALFWVYIAIVAISLYSLLGLLVVLQSAGLDSRLSRRTPTRLIALFLLVMAGIFTTLWVGLTLSRLSAGNSLNLMEHHIIGLDGMVLLPLMFIGGWLLLRRDPWGYLLAGILLTKLAILGFTLLVNTGMMFIWQQPIDILQTVLFAIIMVGSLIGLVAYLDRMMTPASGQLHSGTQ